MNPLFVAIATGALFAAGLYLLTDRHPFRRILGFTALGHAVNVTLFATGAVGGTPAFIDSDSVDPNALANPLPQALVLTAIVIGLAIVTLLAAIAFRQHQQGGAPVAQSDSPEP